MPFEIFLQDYPNSRMKKNSNLLRFQVIKLEIEAE
jgi:hypothetical protein